MLKEVNLLYIYNIQIIDFKWNLYRLSSLRGVRLLLVRSLKRSSYLKDK